MTPSAHLNVSLQEQPLAASQQLQTSQRPAFLSLKNPKPPKFNRSLSLLGSIVSLGFSLGGCATAQKGSSEIDSALWSTLSKDPGHLLEAVCKVGRKTQAVQGRVSVKAKSKESSGQFPASVVAKDPGQLILEVTNLFGGTEALITVDGGVYKIDVPGKPERTEKGLGSWGGIPLRWASELFLGRFPCPENQDSSQLKVEVPARGQLKTKSPAHFGEVETFVYDLRAENGTPWPHHIVWQRGLENGVFAVKVEFRFDDPDSETLIPTKWEAASEQGEVKVRWKERKLSP
jgi:predicted  nucleic acid-binding Zn-ribbon protein